MKTQKSQQIQEALLRMRMLHIDRNVIKDFEKKQTIYYSEYQNRYFNATLYWLDNHKEWAEMVKKFEKEHNVTVYHCQLTHTWDGDLLSLLYVSEDDEEWLQDRALLKNNEAFVKVLNLDEPEFSESGYIGIRPSMGGVTRTY